MITLSNAEAALFHALLLNAAICFEDGGRQADRLRSMAARIKPSDDLPEPNRSSHQS